MLNEKEINDADDTGENEIDGLLSRKDKYKNSIFINKMRIIKPVLENNEKVDIAENAARAPFFVIFYDNKFVKSIKNPFTTWGGAGFAVADLLNNEWCDKFIGFCV